MANNFLTPNMGLTVPVPGQEPGPNWANDLNNSLAVIDAHNHAPGSGVQITPNGLNINLDLPLNDNNLISARSLRMQVQPSALAGAADLGCLFVVGVDLYYNDVNGNQIQMTTGGAVNATSSGISSGTASASFVASVLVVNAAANTPANIQGASILLGNNSAGTNYITLAPPNFLASSYQVTLPTLPGAASFLTIDSSGNMGATIATSAGITGSNISSNTVTYANRVALNYALSASCGSFNTSSTSPVSVTNLSVTITTSGKPVMVGLVADGSANSCILETGSGVTNSVTATVNILRGGSNIAQTQLYIIAAPDSGTAEIVNSVPAPFLQFDSPGAGTYTYTATLTASASSGATLSYAKLIAYELG